MSPKGRVQRPLLTAVLVFVLGAAIAAAVARFHTRENERTCQRALDDETLRATDRLAAQIQTFSYGLRGARGAAIATGLERLDRARFRAYSESRDLETEFPGSLGFGIIVRVPAADERRFVATMRSAGFDDFEVRQLEPHGDERYVISLIEPARRNGGATGLDIASEAKRRVAAQSAMRSGAATLTAPITLVQERDKVDRGFLLLLPIVRPGAPLDTPDAREAATVGWSYTPIVIDHALANVAIDEDTSFALRDTGDGPLPFVTIGKAPSEAALTSRAAFPLFGRTWEAEARASSHFVERHRPHAPPTTFVIGLLLSELLAVVAYLLRSAALRAQEASEERARRSAIVECSSDAIVGESLDGIVTDWNAGAERLFGHSASQAVGTRLADLILPEGRVDEYASVHTSLRRGEVVPTFETARKRADGSLVEVEVTASPIRGSSGALVGISTTLRDIGEARQTTRQLRDVQESLATQVRERTAELETALRDSEALLGTIKKQTIVSITDARGRIIEVNDAFCAISGYRREELIGQTHRLVNSGSQPRAFWAAVWRAISKGQSWRGEVCNRAKDGSLYWVDSIIAPYFGEDGRIERYVSIRTDITASKIAEQRLRESESLLDRAGKAANVGAWQVDLATTNVTWSDATFRICEVSPPFAPTMSEMLAMCAPESRVLLEKAIRAAVETGLGWDLELATTTGRGRSTWVRLVAEVERAAERPARLIGTMQDITARKRAELDLQRTSSLLETMLASVSEVAIVATDPGFTIRVFNKGAERLLGYAGTELIGQHTIDRFLLPEEISARSDEIATKTGSRTEGVAVLGHPLALGAPRECTYVTKDGRRVSVSFTMTAMHTANGELSGYVAVAHDVTQRRAYEASLQRDKRQAEDASSAKSRFLANMSHEIRTPMNAIMGLSYLLEQSPLSPDQADLVSKVHVASRSLLALINDILDFSKIEAGELKVERAPFDLVRLVEQVHDIAKMQADSKQIALTLEVAGDVPPWVSGDVTRLSQILTNLLSNAIKFTARGGVTMRISREASTPTASTLRFEVRDTGIGIPPDVQGRLFAPFAQADVSTTRRFGGTGLGLSIVKRLAELMGGTVRLESIEGVGSTFTVTLPFGVAQAARPGPPAEQGRKAKKQRNRLRGLRVLVVDDSEINLTVARRILQLEGAVVTLARNGQEAFDTLAAAPDGFDFVLMDLQMPVLDGCEATKKIRAELPVGKLPIVALTADARTTERERTQEAGMNDFISKPFEVEVVFETLVRHLPPERARALAEAAGATTAPTRDEWPAIEGIDSASARRRLGDDVDTFLSLLEMLGTHHPSESLVHGGEPSTASTLAEHARAMHKLKGAAGSLGATRLEVLCRAAQDASEAGDEARARVATADATRELERIVSEARRLRHARKAA
ncbi:MAG: PAS domain S-box protein [Deltaproteobacteria bacterium]|nr:PAS domain S-box protein [Deltaproteobacteria bacterium]